MTTYTITQEQRKQLMDALEPHKSTVLRWVTEEDAALSLLQSLQPITQEPVAWMTDDGRVCSDSTKDGAMANSSKPSFHIPLYDHPAPQKPAEPLTDGQYDELITQVTKNVPFSWRAFARAVEQAHGIGVKP